MGGSSNSSTSNTVENVSFNNVDYGGAGGAGAGGSLAGNLNMNRSQLTMGDVQISTTDHGTVQAGKELGLSAIASNQATTDLFLKQGGAMVGRAYDDVEDSRELIGSVFTQGVDLVNDTQRTSMQHMSQSIDRALAFASQSSRSEAGQLVENLAKNAAWTFGGVALLYFVMKRKG